MGDDKLPEVFLGSGCESQSKPAVIVSSEDQRRT